MGNSGFPLVVPVAEGSSLLGNQGLPARQSRAPGDRHELSSWCNQKECAVSERRGAWRQWTKPISLGSSLKHHSASPCIDRTDKRYGHAHPYNICTYIET